MLSAGAGRARPAVLVELEPVGLLRLEFVRVVSVVRAGAQSRPDHAHKITKHNFAQRWERPDHAPPLQTPVGETCVSKYYT